MGAEAASWCLSCRSYRRRSQVECVNGGCGLDAETICHDIPVGNVDLLPSRSSLGECEIRRELQTVFGAQNGFGSRIREDTHDSAEALAMQTDDGAIEPAAMVNIESIDGEQVRMLRENLRRAG